MALSRRDFLIGAAAAALGGCAREQVQVQVVGNILYREHAIRIRIKGPQIYNAAIQWRGEPYARYGFWDVFDNRKSDGSNLGQWMVRESNENQKIILANPVYVQALQKEGFDIVNRARLEKVLSKQYKSIVYDGKTPLYRSFLDGYKENPAGSFVFRLLPHNPK